MKGRVQGIPGYVEGGRVLDIGCGFGLLLDLLKGCGWETYGLDLSEAAIRLVRKKGHVGVSGPFAAGLYPPGFFDAVIMSHSIEHLREPGEYLSLANRVLKDGGELVLLAPNAGSLGFRLFRSRWAAMETPRHLFIPSIRAMRALIEGKGFRVVSVSHTGSGWSQSLDYLLNGRHTPSSVFYSPAVAVALEALAQALNLAGAGDSFQIRARKGRAG